MPQRIFTDGVTLEGDGSDNNRVRVKNAGINTVHLGENTVTLAKLGHGVALYNDEGALAVGQKYAPKAVWWAWIRRVALSHSDCLYGLSADNTSEVQGIRPR